MANVLPIDKQIAIVAALSQGSSIRSIERMTGVHRDTITRLGVKVVEVFELHGHPETDTVYAWSHETDEGPPRHVTVLHVHPATSPLAAVRASIARDFYASQATAYAAPRRASQDA